MILTYYIILLILLEIFAEQATLHITVKNGNAQVVKETVKPDSRNESTFQMIKLCKPPDGTYRICTVDRPGDGVFSYSGKYAIPDFSFFQWKEAKLPNFFEFYKWTPPPFKDRKDKMLWIGGNMDWYKIFFCWVRMNIINTNKNIPDFEFLDSSKNNYKTIYEHAQYKNLLDVQGVGYSGRLKYLLLTGAVIYVVDRQPEFQEYWFNKFTPFEHYIPVKQDGSNLVEMYNKYKNSEEIGQRCRKRALEVFDSSVIYSDMKKILSETQF